MSEDYQTPRLDELLGASDAPTAGGQLTDAQRTELDRRLAQLADGTMQFKPWAEVEARILKRLS